MKKRQRKKNYKNGTRQPNILKMLSTRINKTMAGKIASLYGSGQLLGIERMAETRGPVIVGLDFGHVERALLMHQKLPIIPIEPM